MNGPSFITLVFFRDCVQAFTRLPKAYEPFILRVRPSNRKSWQRAYDLMAEQIRARGFTVPNKIITTYATDRNAED